LASWVTSSSVGHLELVVVRHVGRAQLRNALAGLQLLEFGQREVFGEPAGDRTAIDDLGGLAASELRHVGHVGGGLDHGAGCVDDGDGVLVAGDQFAVLGGHQVGFDEIGAVVDGLLVRGQRVFRPLRRSAAVTDDEHECRLHWSRGRRRRRRRR
jgi:hypothetical protein